MGAFIAYSLQWAFCLAAFYLFYKALLSRETFHRFNRIALLVILLLSAILPLISFTSFFSASSRSFHTPVESFLAISEGVQVEGLNSSTSFVQFVLSVLFLVYGVGCLFFGVRSMVSFLRIVYMLQKGRMMILPNHIRLVVHCEDRIAPFSWFNFMVLSEKDLAEAGDIILAHERAHIRLRHTLDLIIAECCCIFQWYNPAAWLLRQELQSIHEFEADQSVLSLGIDARQYQLLIIKKAVGTRLYSLANSFNHSNLKKRITMMLQKKSNAWARLKYAYVLPLSAACIAAFAHPAISHTFDELASVKVSYNLPEKGVFEAVSTSSVAKKPVEAIDAALTTAIVQQKPDSVYQVVDEMPEFPGGMKALMLFIDQNIKYPPNAMKQGIKGLVYVSFTVGKDGLFSDFKIHKSPHDELSEEAIRVIQSMPAWKPGKMNGKIVNTRYTIPIKFRLTQ